MKSSYAPFGLLLVSSICSAQTEAVFPTVYGEWFTMDVHFYWDGTNMTFEYFPMDFQLEVEPTDTLMGLTWRSMNVSGVGQVGWVAVDGQRVMYRYLANYDGYCPQLQDTSAIVLYDFGLDVGDTAYMDIEGDYPVFVDAIDTVLIDGHPRRRFTLLGGSEQWIVGMGSIHGPLHRLQCPFENYYEMNSFCGVYADSLGNEDSWCWSSIVGISEEPSGVMRVYPDPCTDEFTIESSLMAGPYWVTDLRGVSVASGELDGQITKVRLPNLSAGLYVVSVDNDRIKLVVQ